MMDYWGLMVMNASHELVQLIVHSDQAIKKLLKAIKYMNLGVPQCANIALSQAEECITKLDTVSGYLRANTFTEHQIETDFLIKYALKQVKQIQEIQELTNEILAYAEIKRISDVIEQRV